uniref:Uncharacterized protein n=1 Tax=Iridovirus LCIVAC01 TaxID=2506607 RepID=A0A481YQK8_9VIRU|nr:MAG: hypothetical protein LCIVAC01_01580 [Iridovirus LCIVAC01]
MEQTAMLNEINKLKDELTYQNTKMEQLLCSTKNVLNTKIEQCDSTNHPCSYAVSELQSNCCEKCAKRLEQEEREIAAGWKSESDVFCPREDTSFCFFPRGDEKFQTPESEEVWSDEKLDEELQNLEDLMNSEKEKEEIFPQNFNKDLARCVLCRKLIEGHGNNAQPLHEGRCCDECNVTKVIPERFNSITK